MRTSITLARRHGETKLEILRNADVPFGDQLKDVKKQVAAGRTNAEFAELQIWVSDEGVATRAKFQPPTGDQSKKKSTKTP